MARGDKGGKAAKGKGNQDKAAAAPDDAAIRVSAHPAAVAAIRRVRSWAGLAGFAIVALLALRAGVPHAEVVLRGLVGGIVASLAAWAISIALWKRLILAELDALRPDRIAEPAPQP